MLFLSSALACPPSQTRVIESQIRRIDGIRNARSIERDLDGFSTEGGTLIGFSARGKIHKMAATHYGETGKTRNKFYFAGGRLIFISSESAQYEKPIAVSPSAKIKRTTRSRFYFRDGHLLCVLGNAAGNARAPNEHALLLETRELLAVLRAPKR